METLRIAIVGLGRIAPLHLDAVKNYPGATLVAGCDIDKSKAGLLDEFSNAKFYTDYKEMLVKEDIDVLHICLPHYIHTEVGTYAVSRGVNVLSEKPMSIDYNSAYDLVKLAEKKKVLYGVIFQCRYNDSVKMVKRALEENRLGKILTARSTLTWYRSDEYYAEDDWHGTWDKEGGGVIINQAIHSVDLINYLVDSPIKSVDCSMSNRMHQTIAVEDTAEGMVEYENGVRYLFYATNNYGDNDPIQLALHCEKGKVSMDYDNAVIEYFDGTKEEIHEEPLIEAVGGRQLYWGDKHFNQISQFYNSVLGKEELDISGAEALKSHKLICEIYRTGKNRFKKI